MKPPRADKDGAASADLPQNVDAASEDKPAHARAPSIRVIGFPGSFTAWGLDLVRQALGLAGTAIEILPLDRAPSLGAIPWGAVSWEAVPGVEPGTGVRVLLTHGPSLGHADILPGEGSRTIVFLDDPTRALDELVATGAKPRDAASALTATLAPLASVVREPGVLMVRRTAGISAASTLQAIAAHLVPTLSPATMVAPNRSTRDVPEATREASDIAIDLTRQVLTPLVNLVTGTAREPMLWPLSCFFRGGPPGVPAPRVPAPPVVDLVGPRRILYFGPYFHVPRGLWRVDVRLFFSDDVRNTPFAVDACTDVELARVSVHPGHGGLFQASFPLMIEQPEKRVEVRVLLDSGAIEGQVGLEWVTFTPVNGMGH